MPANYWEREAAYRRRIGVIAPIVAGLIFLAFILSGRLEYDDVSRFVGWRGPMELLPEITVEPEAVPPPPAPPSATEPARETAALDVADQPAAEAAPADLEPNPPRPLAKPAPPVPDVATDPTPPAPQEASYSDTYVILHMVKPAYPPRELAAGIEGNVTVELLVNETGNVVEARVVSALGPVSFQESTLAAVREFRFQPLLEDGKPTSMWVKFLVKFRIMS